MAFLAHHWVGLGTASVMVALAVSALRFFGNPENYR